MRPFTRKVSFLVGEDRERDKLEAFPMEDKIREGKLDVVCRIREGYVCESYVQRWKGALRLQSENRTSANSMMSKVSQTPEEY